VTCLGGRVKRELQGQSAGVTWAFRKSGRSTGCVNLALPSVSVLGFRVMIPKIEWTTSRPRAPVRDALASARGEPRWEVTTVHKKGR
jgi:hypothetical protein